MFKSSVVICGLVRNLKHPHILFSALNKIGSLFNRHYIYLYENDSEDDTVKWLQWWKNGSRYRNFLSEKLNRVQNEQDMSLKRRGDMAFYRNKYLEFAKTCNTEYTIIVDTDLYGYSYEGIANTIGHDLDACGSNGLMYRQNDQERIEKLYYDSWAYRDIDKNFKIESNLIDYKRGDSPIEVDSCFGGMAIYKTPILKDVEYEDWDCDHVTLHSQIKKQGYKVWLNPSQITLYTEHYYQF